MNKIILLFAVMSILNSTSIFAQKDNGERCRAADLRLENIETYPQVAQKVLDIDKFTKNWIANNYNSEKKAAVTIPVVVHVLWNEEGENISDAQIQSQFDVLNKDFNKLNSNWEDTPASFKPLVANIGIEFCLASIDPNGNATSGITRTMVNDSQIGETQDFYNSTNGGHDPWDNTKYINVWLANQMDGSLGFATFPGTAMPAESDGVVIPAQYWGTIGTAASSTPNHLGRTATHEFGHYFNLSHVWGDAQSGCDVDDSVEDTPLQFTESTGCPTFPMLDECTSTGDGLMFMNYMDYADDACMTMFSEGQKARLLAALNGPRAGLLSSDGCGLMTGTKELDRSTLKLYPNPTSGILHLKVTLDKLSNSDATLNIYNLSGQLLTTQRAVGGRQTLDLEHLPSGIYYLRLIQNDAQLVKRIIIQNNL